MRVSCCSAPVAGRAPGGLLGLFALKTTAGHNFDEGSKSDSTRLKLPDIFPHELAETKKFTAREYRTRTNHLVRNMTWNSRSPQTDNSFLRLLKNGTRNTYFDLFIWPLLCDYIFITCLDLVFLLETLFSTEAPLKQTKDCLHFPLCCRNPANLPAVGLIKDYVISSYVVNCCL